MHPKTALAIAGASLAIPSSALAAGHHSHPPAAGALRASGHLTRDAAAVRHLHARKHRRHRRHGAHGSTVSAPLQAIAACESGGNPSAIGGGGLYRGKYQFSTATWASVGGTGDPARASEAEQDKRAAMLYARGG